MVDATIERGGTSVTLPLVAEGGGTPLVSHDIGKPEAQPSGGNGVINPRWSDRWSRVETYTLTGQLTGASAHDDAITLADLIKSHSGGTPLTLNIGLSEFDNDISTIPAANQEGALELEYAPGTTDRVSVSLSLTRISELAATGSQDATTPTASGSGPIQLTDGTTTVDLTAETVVSRSVGRPKSVVRRSTQEYHNATDKRKAAFDGFELAFELRPDAVTKVDNLLSIVRPDRGRGAITLDFQGEYGMGAFDVVIAGSGAVRTVRPSGEADTVIVPDFTLRRVLPQ